MECCSNVIDLNIDVLTCCYEPLKNNKEHILNIWLSSARIVNIFDRMNFSLEDFRSEYAYSIFDYFLSFTSTETPTETCPTVRKILLKFKEYEQCAQVLTLLCTHFKNTVLEFIMFNESSSFITNENKQKIYSVLSTIFDDNLSKIMLEYSQEILSKEEVISTHAKLLEESTLLSKTDVNGVLTFVSDSFCKLIGYTREELIGKPHSMMRHKDVSPKLYTHMWNTILSGKIWTGRIKNVTKKNKTILLKTTIIPEYNIKKEIIGYAAIRVDVTDSIVARTDSLTGIMNRRKFEEELLTQIHEFYMEDKIFTLTIIDIDHFKSVNDKFGHIVGDSVLKEFTKIINSHVRHSDIFARWGGEEFVLLLPETNLNGTLEILKRIRKSINTFEFETVGYKTASFGVVEFTFDIDTVDDLINLADKCLYTSKENGRNKIVYREVDTNKLIICEDKK